MANPTTLLTIVHDDDVAPATLSNRLAHIATEGRSGCRALGDFFHALAAGTRQGKVVFAQDSDGAFGTLDVAVVVASCAAGDWLYVGPVGLRCVTGAVTALQDTWTKDTGNTEGAISLAAAINNNTFLAQYVVATNPTAGTVRITSLLPGPICHLIAVRKEVATDAGLAIGGLAGVQMNCLSTTGGTKASGTIACVLANLDDGDTVTIAGKVLTGDTTTPADADEFEVATSNANVATTLKDAINAAEEIRGHVVATVSSATVTIASRVPGTGINALTMATSDADGAVLAATIGDGATSALSAPRTYTRGLP